MDIEVGAKLTGRIGRWNLGVIDIKQAGYEGVESSNLFVGRAVANVLDESNLGVIVTDGDPHSNLDNTVVGVDFRYLNSRLPGRRTAEGEAWYQKSSTPGLDGDDTAFGAGFAFEVSTSGMAMCATPDWVRTLILPWVSPTASASGSFGEPELLPPPQGAVLPNPLHGADLRA